MMRFLASTESGPQSAGRLDEENTKLGTILSSLAPFYVRALLGMYVDKDPDACHSIQVFTDTPRQQRTDSPYYAGS